MVTSGSFSWRTVIAGEGPGVQGAMRPARGRQTLDTGPLTSISGSMNDPEVTMSHATSHTDLVAYTRALEAAGLAIKLVSRVPAPLRSIADQLIRSASSVPANLAEGHGRFGRDRQHHWRIAYASAKEAECHLRLLAAAGAVHGSGVTKALESFDQVRAMTWRLLHPR